MLPPHWQDPPAPHPGSSSPGGADKGCRSEPQACSLLGARAVSSQGGKQRCKVPPLGTQGWGQLGGQPPAALVGAVASQSVRRGTQETGSPVLGSFPGSSHEAVGERVFGQ